MQRCYAWLLTAGATGKTHCVKAPTRMKAELSGRHDSDDNTSHMPAGSFGATPIGTIYGAQCCADVADPRLRAQHLQMYQTC